jgi:cytochrome c biogenesis protein ResB
MLGRSVLISGKGYVRITLDEKETNEAMENLLRFNLLELARVIKVAKGSSMSIDLNQQEMIRLLFDKQALSAFTLLQVELDKKIENEKKKKEGE